MKIRFFYKDTDETLDSGYYFVDASGDVYKSNEMTDRQGFDSCVEECKDVSWEAYQEYETRKER